MLKKHLNAYTDYNISQIAKLWEQQKGLLMDEIQKGVLSLREQKCPVIYDSILELVSEYQNS